MSVLRVLIDLPASGAWNMAVDEALLESAAERGRATLRFYQWEVPTLSLGYFQQAADREQHAASRACPLVRRASGGGAIVHDRELTYSIALPLREVRGRAATELYDACHESLIGVLTRMNVAAAIFRPPAGTCDRAPETPKRREPFLCFQRLSCGDIVCGEHKIVGSAQRRRRVPAGAGGAVLQHGSILLAASPCAAELPGIAQLTGHRIEPEQLANGWIRPLAERLAMTAVRQSLSDHETQIAAKLSQSRYNSLPLTLCR